MNTRVTLCCGKVIGTYLLGKGKNSSRCYICSFATKIAKEEANYSKRSYRNRDDDYEYDDDDPEDFYGDMMGFDWL